MFESFQSKTDKEWIDRANDETSKFDFIAFPYTFELDGITLNAINTRESFQSKKAIGFERLKTQTYPLKSIVIQESDSEGLSKEVLTLGIQDILLDHTLLDHTRLIEGEIDISSLSSIGINYTEPDWEKVKRLIDNLALQDNCRVTLFNCSLIDSDIEWGIQKFADSIRAFSKNDRNNFHFLGIRGDSLGNWGATAVHELAASLSILAHFWDKLSDEEVSLNQLINQTEIALSLSGEFYTDVAKFKAARLLLYHFLEAFGVDDPNPYKIKIRAVSGTLNKTLYESDGNLLRNTVEVLAATIAESDIITVRPHDFRHQNSTLFGQRMAVNVQHLLEHEGQLQAANNYSDGSYFLEKMINKMVEEAWQLFLKIEEEGGYYKSDLVNRKLYQHNIKERENSLLKQNKIMIGVTRYANPLEKQVSEKVNPAQKLSPLTNRWEALRLKIDQLSARERPSVAILTGIDRDNIEIIRKITFVSSLLTSVGLGIKTTGESLTDSIKKSTPDIVFFCVHDQWYDTELEEFTSQQELQHIAKVGVGSSPVLINLQRSNTIDAIIHEQADLTQFFDVLNTLIL